MLNRRHFLAAASGAALASCNRSDGRKIIGVVPKGASHLFWQTIHAGALKAASEADLDQIAAVVDVFHYVQPQLLLLLAALAEAMEKEQIGGYGKPDPRPVTDRERVHLATHVPSVDEGAGALPLVSEALGR